ncbi:protein PROCA1 isoform X1 [Rhinolophus ferrumequinum]|uniref:protein PROCA1 isoform X1 n=1 Tax=Rhinolophus ferrumequinum TaxID=59479 RepID=UPI00140F537C|nr:protein PROCA1 isoform X1 [Rhinolophus ferrumequinum]
MWVRTTMTVERWTKEKTEDEDTTWDESSRDIKRLPSWQRGHLCVASSTDASSTVSSEAASPLCSGTGNMVSVLPTRGGRAHAGGEFKDSDRCCWKHKQCTGHIICPFTSDCGHHNLHLHSVSHCDCDSRVKECLETTNSSGSRDVGPTCSRDVGSACFNIIQTPCFELIPEEECVERFWYGWCKSYRPLSVAVIHHPIHHKCGADEEEEEEEEASKPPIPTQVGPTPPGDAGIGTGAVMATPDSAAPITIWRSDSPTGKSQGSKVLKKVKKKKEKEKDKEEDMDEKAKLKKKVKKGKLTKKKSQVKSDSSPPDLSRSVSPRELARTSESSPDSREDLESEDSYNDPRPGELSSEDVVESSSPRKREKNTGLAKKPGPKASPVKVNRKKSPPASNPNLS